MFSTSSFSQNSKEFDLENTFLHFPVSWDDEFHTRLELVVDGKIFKTLEKVKRRKVDIMFFLVSEKKIEAYKGRLEDLPIKQAAGVQKALEVRYCLEMTMSWVPEGRAPKKVSIPGAGTKTLCVLEKTGGELSLETVDPGQIREDISKVFLVHQTYIRQFVPVRTDLNKTSKAKGKNSSGKKVAK